MRYLLRLRILDKVLLIGAAVASAAFVALLPKLMTGSDTVKEPFPRVAEHAEV